MLAGTRTNDSLGVHLALPMLSTLLPSWKTNAEHDRIHFPIFLSLPELDHELHSP